jgi:hypothetical protein
LIATDPLSLVFIFCFLLGFGFFIASALLGGHGQGHAHGTGHTTGHAHVAGHATGHATHAQSAGEHTHIHAPIHAHGNQHAPGQTRFALFGYLNPMSIALFLLGFGFFGYFFHNLANLAASLTVILAVGSGLVIAVLLFLLLNRLFANSEGSTEQDVADRTGMIGKVSITIPEKGIGEIIYTSPGGLRKSIPARGLNNQGLERDLEVVVVNYQSGVAEVDTWEDFIHTEASFTDPSALDKLNQLPSLAADFNSSEIEMVIHQEKKE